MEVLPVPPNEAIVIADAPHITLHDDVTGGTINNVGYSLTNDDSIIEVKKTSTTM